MTTARALSIGFVGNVVTNPFGKLSGRLADLTDATCAHFPIAQIEQVLAGPAFVDFPIVHLDHRWFFDVVPPAARLERGSGTIILNTVPVSSVESDLHDQLEALVRVNAVLFDLARSQERVSGVNAAGAFAILGFATAFRERNHLLYQVPYAPAAVDALVERYPDSVAVSLRAHRKVAVVDANISRIISD